MTRSHQITMHTRSLRRWFDEAEARSLATKAVDSGCAWKWHEPKQLELF